MRVLERSVEAEFKKFKRNVYSQWGEDGIIEFLLEKTKINPAYFVEFGAWDGRHLSNTAYLAEKGCAGCFIEGDSDRFEDLKRNFGDNKIISKLNKYVGWSDNDSLDSLLDQVAAPKKITVLSIDIDGNDYAVWAAVKKYTADIVIVEFNPTIPAHIVYTQELDSNVNFGNSLAALWELGEAKGYVLVATTETNAIFLDKNIAESFNVQFFKPWEIKDFQFETFIFHGYNGVLRVGGAQELVWHGVSILPPDFQPLPLDLRRIPAGQATAYYEALDRFKAGLDR